MVEFIGCVIYVCLESILLLLTVNLFSVCKLFFKHVCNTNSYPIQTNTYFELQTVLLFEQLCKCLIKTNYVIYYNRYLKIPKFRNYFGKGANVNDFMVYKFP